MFGYDPTLDVHYLLKETNLTLDKKKEVFFNFWTVISASPK